MRWPLRQRSPPRIRALVLAAGEGMRLRPLTGYVPKPLLPVAGRSLLEHSLERLRALGCEAVAINLHHLGETIRQTIGDDYQGLPVTYSPERELRGTLGAFGPLRDFFAEADVVLLLNGDSLCRWPLRKMLRRHLHRGAAATLLVARRADPAAFGGGIGIDKQRRIRDFRGRGQRAASAGAGVERRVFAGAHLLAPRLLERASLEGHRDIVSDLYEPLLQEELLQAVPTRAIWHDLGTPQRYLLGTLDFIRGRRPGRWWRRRWIARSARIGRGARVRRSVIEAGAQVESGAILQDCLVLTGARVGRGSRLRASVIGPGVELPRDSGIDGRLVTPLRAGRDPHGRDSVVGRLVYTPIAAP